MSATFYLSASCLSLHPLHLSHPHAIHPVTLPCCIIHPHACHTTCLPLYHCFFEEYISLFRIYSISSPLRCENTHSLPLPSTNHGLLPHFTPSCKAHNLFSAIEHFFEQYISLPKFISSLPPSKVEKFTPPPPPQYHPWPLYSTGCSHLSHTTFLLL